MFIGRKNKSLIIRKSIKTIYNWRIDETKKLKRRIASKLDKK